MYMSFPSMLMFFPRPGRLAIRFRGLEVSFTFLVSLMCSDIFACDFGHFRVVLNAFHIPAYAQHIHSVLWDIRLAHVPYLCTNR